MWRTVLKTLDSSPAAWQGIPALVAAHGRLAAVLGKAEAAATTQQSPTTGLTLDKAAAESHAIDLLLDLAGAAKAYAIDAGNNDLYAHVSDSRSALERLPDNALLARLRGLADTLAPLAPRLADFGVTPAEVTAATTALTAYGNAIATPRTAISSRKTASDTIPALLKEGRQVLAQLDALMRRLRGPAPALTAAYRNARTIVDAGTRHAPPAPSA